MPTDGTRFRMHFMPGAEPKVGPNRIHLDLTTTSLDDQRDSVARLVELARATSTSASDPTRNISCWLIPRATSCVIEPGNSFLADCGRLGAINCDGTTEVGYFWATRSAGRWCGIRTTRRRSVRLTAPGRSSPGVGRPGPEARQEPAAPRGRAADGADSPPRSSVSWRSARPGSTSARATSTGSSWPIPTATSSRPAARVVGDVRPRRDTR